jgi:hypothetical protein
MHCTTHALQDDNPGPRANNPIRITQYPLGDALLTSIILSIMRAALYYGLPKNMGHTKNMHPEIWDTLCFWQMPIYRLVGNPYLEKVESKTL